jgi:hypothetical protein
MNVADLRALIQSVLQAAPQELYSAAAEELLVATCAQESHLGQYRQQINGPALGIFQVEPNTWDDVFRNYLMYHDKLNAWVRSYIKLPVLGARELITNDSLSIAMVRAIYLRAPEALPAPTDLGAIYALYKKRFNTPLGAATWQQFRTNYATYVPGGPAS